MARMHSRKRGKAGSKKPAKPTTPVWTRYKPKEVELLITKFAKEGKTASQIGLILRDKYGVPNERLISGKRITQILKEKSLLQEIPEDLMALIRKEVNVKKHLEENKVDMSAKRGLQLTGSKIKRLIKHYKKSGKLTSDWKYDSKRAGLLME